MLREIFQNLLVTVICSAILWAGKKVWGYLSTRQPKPSKYTPKALVANFYIGLIVLVISIIVFCTVPPSYIAVRTVSGLFAGLSFLAVWGAFEEAQRFYPCNEAVNPEQAKENARENGNN